MAKKDFFHQMNEMQCTKQSYLDEISECIVPPPIPSETLNRILQAGHAAGSVGMMQPWNFIVLDDVEKRSHVHQHFVECNARAAAVWKDESKVHYGALKLQGILDSPTFTLSIFVITLVVANMFWVVIPSQKPTYDTVHVWRCKICGWLLVQKELEWGWHIMEPEKVKSILEIPEHVSIIAYMTVGFPTESPKHLFLKPLGGNDELHYTT